MAVESKKMGGLQRKSRVEETIPTASMADIAFLLLIFFMVTTVMRKETPLKIAWPEAQALRKTEFRRKNILHVWVNHDDPATAGINEEGWVYVDDVAYNLMDGSKTNMLVEKLRQEYTERKGKLLIAFRADKNTPYNKIDRVLEALKAANTVQVMFATTLEQEALDLSR
ncbi:MAG: biopolymer transporter ExbD [Candidatus Glassbacteria bacterium]|nr:biopolymer transporter ExbD [Candidatus Glassbacteria bacterium]